MPQHQIKNPKVQPSKSYADYLKEDEEKENKKRSNHIYKSYATHN